MSELKPIGEVLKGIIKEIPPNKKPNNNNDDDNNKINFDDLEICKFPRDVVEYNQNSNCLNSTIIKDEGKTYMEKEFKNLSGYDYKVISLLPFNKNKTLFDLKVLLVISYLTDFFKRRFITVSFTDFIKLLGVKDTGHYRRAIIKTLDYHTCTTYKFPYIWDFNKRQRNDDVPLTDKGIIDYSKLTSFSVFHIINSYHIKNLNDLRSYKSRIEIELSQEFYHRFLNYYIVIDFKKAVKFKNPTSLNLYLFMKNNWGIKKSHKYSIGFEKLKKEIGITDTNKSRAKDTFKTAWREIKNQGLLPYISYYPSPSKTGKKNIHFKLVN
ncbi:hypothetical protein ES703_34281 [subsurface metagenome]